MAIAHLSVRVGRLGKAKPHAAYIARIGEYARCMGKGEQFEASGVGNMPAWATENPLTFWEAADAYERKNGSTYREMEIALPRELTPEQRRELAEEWVAQEIGEQHPYQWAIHNPRSSGGLDQPHVHLMVCERTLDGIERDPEQFFRRYNTKNPEKGGARKANTGKDRATRIQELKELRERWELTCNRALERAGIEKQISMKSYKDRGLNEIPEKKYQPGEWRHGGSAEVIEFRRARKELRQAREALDQEIPSVLISLEEHRQRAEREQREMQEALRVSKTAQRSKVQGVQGQRLDLNDPTQATIHRALGGHVRIAGGEIHADIRRNTAFRLGGDDAEILERLRASGLPPAVVVAEIQRGNLTAVLKHRPIGQTEREGLVQAVDRAVGRRLERVAAIVPARVLVLEASGREVDLERVLGRKVADRGMER